MNDVFLPGEKINLSCLERRKYAIKVPKIWENIKLKIPSRIHISLLNDERISLWKPWGGALGMAVDMFQTEVIITVKKDQGIIISPRYSPNIEHIIKVLAKVFWNEVKRIHINIKKNTYTHIGFGSSVMQVFWVAFWLNYLFWSPLSNKELRKIIWYNYVENVKWNKKVSLWYETWAGVACALYGWLLLLTDQLEIVEKMQIENIYKVICFIPTKEYTSNKNKKRDFLWEVNVFYESKKFHPLLNATAEKVLYDLIPAMKQKNMELLGEIIYDLNFMMWTMWTIRSRYSVWYYVLFEKLRELWGTFVWISSTGPMIYVLVHKNKSDKIIDFIKEKKFDLLWEWSVSQWITVCYNDKESVISVFPDSNVF